MLFKVKAGHLPYPGRLLEQNMIKDCIFEKRLKDIG